MVKKIIFEKELFKNRKLQILLITSLFFTTTFFNSAIAMNTSNDLKSLDILYDFSSYEHDLDIGFIYNITENLSNIIFTEYDEEAGEIAKGRAFGTKGEHKAAEILYENMSKLGLDTELQKIANTKKHPKLTHSYDIFDKKVTLRNIKTNETEILDSWVSPIEISPPFIENKMVNYSLDDLKIKEMPRTILGWIKAIAEDRNEDNYLFISDIRGGLCRNPNPSLPIDIKIMRKFFYPVRVIPSIAYTYFRRHVETFFLDKFFNNCNGRIIYDFTNDTHNTAVSSKGFKIPKIIINGTIGNKILSDIENYTVDFYLKEMYNKSKISYNVIGLLNGTDKTKTVIVDCLYDSVWCQGTGDAALGMGIVMGVAKFFSDNNIIPKYNIKFIGFGAEEAGLRGSIYYEETHRDEDIKYVIDMNQVCSAQSDPELTLNLLFNNRRFMKEIWPIVQRSEFEERVNNTFIEKRWCPIGAPSDDQAFAKNRFNKVKTVCFLEDFPWIWHHRDGLNHKAGDVFDHLDWNEVRVTTEIVTNITLYLTVEPSQIDNNIN